MKPWKRSMLSCGQTPTQPPQSMHFSFRKKGNARGDGGGLMGVSPVAGENRSLAQPVSGSLREPPSEERMSCHQNSVHGNLFPAPIHPRMAMPDSVHHCL